MTETNGQHATTEDAERRLSPSVRLTLETARAIAARGGTVTGAAVAKERNVASSMISLHRKKLWEEGLWPWPVVKGRPTKQRPTPTAIDTDAIKAVAEISHAAIQLREILRRWPPEARSRLCLMAMKIMEGHS